MTTRLCLVAGAIAIQLCSYLNAPSAWAACNAAPSYFSFVAHRAEENENIQKTIPEGMPFRGERGRINVAVLPRAGEATIELSTDPHCDGDAGAKTDHSAVALLFYADGENVRRFEPHAPNAQACTAWTKAWEAQHGSGSAPPCADDLRGEKHRTDGSTRYSLSLRPLDAAGESVPVVNAPLVTALVLQLPKDGDVEASAITDGVSVGKQALSGNSCATLLANPVAASAVRVCVDRIYTDFGPGNRCSIKLAAMEPGHCRLIRPFFNAFDQQCKAGPGCNPKRSPADKIYLAVDTMGCGAVGIAFNYRTVRQNKTKTLVGRSAVSRSSNDPTLGPIVIPGDEFLGSIRPGYSPGDFKKPDLRRTSGARPSEVALEGSVDESESVVMLLPRLPVSKICKARSGTKEQACQTFEPRSSKLACSEPGDACEDLASPAYFYCESSDATYRYTGMPCTRPAHCRLDGQIGECTGRPTCVASKSVWTGAAPSAGEPCTSDGRCGNDQCGYSLFDFTGRNSIARVVAGGQRGSCIDSSGTSHGDCSETAACADAQHTCEGYVLLDAGVKD